MKQINGRAQFAPAPLPHGRSPVKHIHPLWAAVFFAVFHLLFFSPVLFSGKQLAPGDGAVYYYPHYNTAVQLWDPLLMTGYPAMADPQLMNWYPPALLLRYIPGSWNAFVLLAYTLASWFMFLFVRRLTGKDFAGLVAGLIFGLCGFMNAHLGHITMIQAATWIPAALYCLERLAEDPPGLRWVGLGGLSLGACMLGGHPQIALYGIALVASYAAVRGIDSASPRWRYYVSCAIMIGAGAALGAIQILPSREIAGLSTRATLSFDDFSQYALPSSQLATFLFPNLFGSVGTQALSRIPYFGSPSITEVSGYAGSAALVLALFAAVSRRTLAVVFWLASAAIAVLAAMGGATPLGRLIYALPAFGQFRAQARFLLVFDIAAAVLAGYGLAIVLERKRPVLHSILTLCAGLGLIGYAARIALVNAGPLTKAALSVRGRAFTASPFQNPWIGATVLIGCALCAVLAALIHRPGSPVLRAVFLMGLVIELGQFSWFGDWRYNAPSVHEFDEPQLARRDAAVVQRVKARWLAPRGVRGKTEELPGDLPDLWKLPSLGKYGPLLPSRYKDLMRMEVTSGFQGQWWDPRDQALDIAGGRFIALPDRASTQDLPLSVGHECGADGESTIVPVDPPDKIRGIALVTMTGCSTPIEQGTTVAEVLVQTTEGAQIPLQIREGVETAEWAAGCADVVPTLRHRQAEVDSRRPVPRGAGLCQALTYKATLSLPHPVSSSGMQIRWLAPGLGMLKIDKITLLEADGSSHPLSERDVRFGDTTRWQRFDQAAGVAVYENLRARPRAWLVPETLQARPAQIMSAIQMSSLPDGKPYDPAAVALVEEPAALHAAPDPSAKAAIVRDENTTVEVRTSSSQPAFLVLGDFYYPGWQATVNGRAAHIFQTNYIQRGVLLPAGQNQVQFLFRPRQFYLGAAITLGTLALLAGAIFLDLRRKGVSAVNPL